jgi:flagellar hook protein FlgE
MGNVYSRAGNLHVDADNTLAADNGFAIQGPVRDPLTGKIDRTPA